MDILQYDGRISLTDLSKKINLSIDSTHKRLKKLIKQEIIFPTILIDPRKVGYPLIVDVKIKLKDIDEEKYKKLTTHLTKHPNVLSLFAVSGDYDLTAPIMAKDYNHLNKISLEIRGKFKDIIADWKSGFNTTVFKYEKLDFTKL